MVIAAIVVTALVVFTDVEVSVLVKIASLCTILCIRTWLCMVHSKIYSLHSHSYVKDFDVCMNLVLEIE